MAEQFSVLLNGAGKFVAAPISDQAYANYPHDKARFEVDSIDPGVWGSGDTLKDVLSRILEEGNPVELKWIEGPEGWRRDFDGMITQP
ncbi:hypothetical protein ACFL1U_01520 [Patescibacteria group bacterium]